MGLLYPPSGGEKLSKSSQNTRERNMQGLSNSGFQSGNSNKIPLLKKDPTVKNNERVKAAQPN